MDGWSGYSIAAAILVIVAIIMIIAGIVMLESATDPKKSADTIQWPWLLIIGGIILLIIGIVVGYMGRSTAAVAWNHTGQTVYHHAAYADPGMGMPYGYPGYGQYVTM
jgi:uncharacterized membrane protein